MPKKLSEKDKEIKKAKAKAKKKYYVDPKIFQEQILVYYDDGDEMEAQTLALTVTKCGSTSGTTAQ